MLQRIARMDDTTRNRKKEKKKWKLYTSNNRKIYTWMNHYLFSWSNGLLCILFIFPSDAVNSTWWIFASVWKMYEKIRERKRNRLNTSQRKRRRDRDRDSFSQSSSYLANDNGFDDGDRIFISVLCMHVLAVRCLRIKTSAPNFIFSCHMHDGLLLFLLLYFFFHIVPCVFVSLARCVCVCHSEKKNTNLDSPQIIRWNYTRRSNDVEWVWYMISANECIYVDGNASLA